MEDRGPYMNHTVLRHPALPPPRIELNILQSHYTKAISDVEPEVDGRGIACPMCPDTSSRTIPSMVYDAINCPHNYIQPTHGTIMAHPWSANTCERQIQSREWSPASSLQSEAISFFSDENETLAPPSPNFSSVARTAPNRRNVYNGFRKKPPYTAPVITNSNFDGPSDKRPGSNEEHNVPVFEGKYLDPSE